VGGKQSAYVVLYILEPPLDQLGTSIPHNSVGHLNAKAFEYAGRSKRFASIGQFFLGAVAAAAHIGGQIFATVIHINPLWYAMLLDTQTQRIQCSLAACPIRDKPANKNSGPGIQPC